MLAEKNQYNARKCIYAIRMEDNRLKFEIKSKNSQNEKNVLKIKILFSIIGVKGEIKLKL